MNSNLDVWAIQYYPEELLTALNQIKEGMNIIYSNCTSLLLLGSQSIVTRQFDTFLYNEESDVLIMLMRDGKATKEDIVKYLEQNNKEYTEVTFAPSITDYHDGNNIPVIWFSREQYVLEDALKESLNNGITHCEFYPNLLGNLNLGYISNVDQSEKVEGRLFKGLVKLDDKIILIINQTDNLDKNNKTRNMTSEQILQTINNFGFECEVIFDKEPNLSDENLKKKK